MSLDRMTIRLQAGRDRRIKAGHPWAFSNEIVMTPAAKALPPGSVVRLEGDDGVKHGAFHFNPHSLIAARRLSADPDAACDAGWFRARLAEALALRDQLFDVPHYRLVHAEADGLPGLVIDRYGDVVALQANTAGMEAATPLIVEALTDLIAPRGIVARNDSAVRALEGLAEQTTLLHGDAAGAVVEEGGRRFPVDLLGGQKTGWFFDQREHRARVSRLATGATVLDAFCHTGGFGIGCAVAGAAQVTLLDRSEHALATATEAAAMNGVADRVTTQRGEAMDALERMVGEGRRFGVVITDPPAFAKTRKDQPAALRAYGKLARLAASLTAPGGFLFIASCSHHVGLGDFADAVAWGTHRASRQGRAPGEVRQGCAPGEVRDARILHMGGAGPDHPLHPMLPESQYLKGILLHLP